jgi:16S rRNA (cytosine967-C5)-methyltransferase
MSLSWTIAIEALSWIVLERLTGDASIRKTVRQLKVRERGVVDEARSLVHETMMRRNAIDYIVNSAIEPMSLGNMNIGLRSYLRLFTHLAHYGKGTLSDAYQLSEHIKDLLHPKELRKIESAVEIIPFTSVPLEDMGGAQRLAYQHFHPLWYVKYLTNHLGRDLAEDLIRHTEYPSYLRINTLKSGAESIDDLAKLGVQLEKEPLLSHIYKIIAGDGLTDLDGYKKGRYIIQDKASIIVGEIASPKPGETVLDVCAAPGVKTSHMAQMMGNTGRILSVDYNERRLRSWSGLMKKLGVENADPLLADATQEGSILDIEADLVVVDPPCTGTGTFHKVPSAKWRLTRRSMEKMANLQRRILENSASYLREGGTLVYSTCSITLEENEGIVNGFLQNHSEYELVEAPLQIGLPGLEGLDKAQRLYPHIHGCNGFFIAKLVKSL